MSRMKWLIFAGLLVLPGCFSTGSRGGGGDLYPPTIIPSANGCDVTGQKRDLLDIAQSHYLFPDLLPANVDDAAYPTQETLLSALTANARALGKDRQWSALTTKTENQDLFAQGKVQGFGFQLSLIYDNGGTPFLSVADVTGGSPAAAAHIVRGDLILAVATSAAGLDLPASQTPGLVASGALNTLLSPAPPAPVWFRVRSPQAAFDTMVTPAVYSLDPVPGSAAPIVLDAGNGHRVGYVLFRTFIGPAAEALRTAIGNLRQAGATDLVIDLRYNGGGLTSVAEVLANLLRRTHSPADVMAKTVHNPQQAASDTAILFGAEPNAMDPGKIAFIVGGGTASASEMVVNVLQPYLGSNLALVGSRTYGKPVGMEAFDNSSCDWLLYLVSFSVVNADGRGGYFQGLPDAGFRGISIAALDDQAYALGNPAEPSLAAALAWIGQGQTGSPIPPAAAGALKPADGAARILHPSPTLAQQFQPGLF